MKHTWYKEKPYIAYFSVVLFSYEKASPLFVASSFYENSPKNKGKIATSPLYVRGSVAIIG
jgi:hypothetical protein